MQMVELKFNMIFDENQYLINELDIKGIYSLIGIYSYIIKIERLCRNLSKSSKHQRSFRPTEFAGCFFISFRFASNSFI